MDERTLANAMKTALKEHAEETQVVKHEFWIDREPHYAHHKSFEEIGLENHEVHHTYTKNQIEFWGWIRETMVKAIVYSLVGGILGLVALGFLVWVKYGDKIGNVVGG